MRFIPSGPLSLKGRCFVFLSKHSMEENINVIVDSIKVVILDFIKEHWEPSQKHLLDVVETNKSLERTNLSLSDEVQKHRHFSDLLSEKVKSLEEDMRNMTNVSIIRSWEKKVSAKEQELVLLQQRLDKMERSMKTMQDVNTVLNTRLEIYSRNGVDCLRKDADAELGPAEVVDSSALAEPESFAISPEPMELLPPQVPPAFPTDLDPPPPVSDPPAVITVSPVTPLDTESSPPHPPPTSHHPPSPPPPSPMVQKKIKGILYFLDSIGQIYTIDEDGNPLDIVGKKMERGYKFFSKV